MAQVRVYKTTESNVLASHRKDRETGRTFWRLYTENADGKLHSIGTKEEAEVRQCELCGRLMLNPSNNRFCSDYCGEEHFRRMSIDAEENTFWSDDY